MDNGSSLLNHIPHIGIVAGTADGAALCYRALCHEGEPAMTSRRPEITMHTVPLDLYLDAIDRDDWKGVAALMSRSASVLAQAGAELIICPNNTLHRAFEFIISPVPWLHIATAVGAEVLRRGFRRVGLLGTHVVMEGTIYQPILEQHGIEIVVPNRRERIELDRIIRTELIRGHYTADSRVYVRSLISTMADYGVDAIILGCTELPLLLSDAPSHVPLLDSTRLLAAAALTTSPLVSLSY
jgi:aspartate racemase